MSKEEINPDHYKHDGLEVIDMMLLIFGKDKTISFCELNAFKYRMRAGKKKGQPIDREIKKALWYEKKIIELNA